MFSYEDIQNNPNTSYIGKFVSDGERLTYYTPTQKPNGKNDNAPIKALGDVVYFMFVNQELTKIGKAGSAHGFIGRARTYTCDPKHHDATTPRIISVMAEMGADEMEVYAVQTPRAITRIINPITNEIETVESPTNGHFETILTAQYLEMGGTLEMCVQTK